MSPPEAEASVITASARSTSARESASPGLRARCDGGSVSCGATRTNQMPKPMLARPGTTNAARQPRCSTR